MVSHHNNAKAKVFADSRLKFNCNGYITRNRALSGDKVYAEVLEADADPESDSTVSVSDSISLDEVATAAEAMATKACKVVGIQKRSGQRFVSRVKPGEPLVQPRDTRFPAMRSVSPVTVDKTSLGVYTFSTWEETEQYPDCNLVRILGPEGSFSAEDDSTLELRGLLSDAYSVELDKKLRSIFPSASAVVKAELGKRRDLRKTHRVFSIDPPSAKDLDDAISIEKSKSGNSWKIGVHVADVSHFVSPGSEVDKEAALRATSVYLPRRVYPMLPPYLSENLCSLLPGEDRLAVSVFFVVNEDSGEVMEAPVIERTVIRSRAKLGYDNLGSDPGILKDIEILMKLTGKMRNNRIAAGSVTIDDRNTQELVFEFNDAVIAVKTEAKSTPGEIHDSHTLIEELMVMANKIVAEKLCESSEVTVPVVRRHVDSEKAVIEQAIDFLSKADIPIPSTPVKSITELMLVARQQLDPGLYSTFTHSILGEFNRAEYVANDSAVGHWGVGAKRYMHFTSPIRRYADLIAHRKLGMILGWTSDCMVSEDSVREQIARCNTNSRAAKEAEKDNRLFYFTSLVKSFGNHGMYLEGFVKSLVPPEEEKNVKGSICFFLPAIGEIRSQSLESLGLSFSSMETFPDGAVKSIIAKDRKGAEVSFKSLQRVVLRAFVKNPNASIPKLLVRLDEVPRSPNS